MNTIEHMIFTGPCGSGKSVAMAALAETALAQGRTVHIISPADAKSRNDYDALVPRLATYAGSAEDAPSILHGIVTEMESHKESAEPWQGALVLVDDIVLVGVEEYVARGSRGTQARNRNTARERAMHDLGCLIRDGSICGIQVIVACQQAYGDTIPRDILANIPCRVLLTRANVPPEHTLQIIFGPGHAAEAMQILRSQEPRPGAGVAFSNGKMVPVSP